MNIYIHLEILDREIDSKLTLAMLAASRGHHVIVSDQESIIKGLTRKFLFPGIFHTKSLSPGESKIKIHDRIINTGCKITSIDEEGGLVDYGYRKFAKDRYSNRTLKQASAVFTWGPEDSQTLKKIYPKYSKKIYMTGSARADVWQPFFKNYWKRNFRKFTKPFLLVSSNLGGPLCKKSLQERFKIAKKAGYFNRNPQFRKTFFQREKEQSKLIVLFTNAIKHLSTKNKKYDIILRPHPEENIYLWKDILSNLPNVKVIYDDTISYWVANSFAVMHNGCTTAVEASLFRKPVVSYIPFKSRFLRDLANGLGYKVTSDKELANTVNNLYNNSKSKNKKKINKSIPKILSKKIFVDEKEFAAKKMIRVWESISDETLKKLNNWIIFWLSLKVMKFNGTIFRFFKKTFSKNHKIKRNYKFPPFNKEKINNKIKELEKLLRLKNKLDYKLLSDRTILIKPK